jgi:energy-coupling factor transporter ATP-binding protein EcfA2
VAAMKLGLEVKNLQVRYGEFTALHDLSFAIGPGESFGLVGESGSGKSTVLRALSISALLAHTYGCSFGYLTLTPFHKMFVCLKPDDLPGSKSRFEREIEFTANTLKLTEPSLVFIDELYHSTNPPDALRSCQIYCGKLWPKPNIISVISTHLFELVDTADKDIQRLCCPATGRTILRCSGSRTCQWSPRLVARH